MLDNLYADRLNDCDSLNVLKSNFSCFDAIQFGLLTQIALKNIRIIKIVFFPTNK